MSPKKWWVICIEEMMEGLNFQTLLKAFKNQKKIRDFTGLPESGGSHTYLDLCQGVSCYFCKSKGLFVLLSFYSIAKS